MGISLIRLRPFFSRLTFIFGWKIQLAVWLAALLYTPFAFGESAAVPAQTGVRDFVEYWAASRLFLQGGNPYSPVELAELQRLAGAGDIAPLIMWNPPWSLLFLLPFGLLSFNTGQFCWLLFHVLLVLFSAQWLWRFYGDTPNAPRVAWVLALTFIPTIFVLIIGQITPLILAGLTAFLYFERKKKWWAVSVALLILSVKAHLLYLFWIVFLLWIWDKRQWRVIRAAALIGVIALALPLLVDSKIYSEYAALYQAANVTKPFDWPTPALRNVVRILFASDHLWLQMTPTIATLAWVLYYWHLHKQQWSWSEQLPLLTLVSVAGGFFSWTYDQVVFLPAIVQAAVWISHMSVPWHKFWTTRVYIAINTCHLVSRVWLAEELWYFWLAPALLANYLLFRWESSRQA